jgi:hypothetical protein
MKSNGYELSLAVGAGATGTTVGAGGLAALVDTAAVEEAGKQTKKTAHGKVPPEVVPMFCVLERT